MSNCPALVLRTHSAAIFFHRRSDRPAAVFGVSGNAPACFCAISLLIMYMWDRYRERLGTLAHPL